MTNISLDQLEAVAGDSKSKAYVDALFTVGEIAVYGALDANAEVEITRYCHVNNSRGLDAPEGYRLPYPLPSEVMTKIQNWFQNDQHVKSLAKSILTAMPSSEDAKERGLIVESFEIYDNDVKNFNDKEYMLISFDIGGIHENKQFAKYIASDGDILDFEFNDSLRESPSLSEGDVAYVYQQLSSAVRDQYDHHSYEQEDDDYDVESIQSLTM